MPVFKRLFRKMRQTVTVKRVTLLELEIGDIHRSPFLSIAHAVSVLLNYGDTVYIYNTVSVCAPAPHPYGHLLGWAERPSPWIFIRCRCKHRKVR